MRRGTLVLASHTFFDELLIVGYNAVLAARLGMDIATSVCIKGYKGDAERKIGIVGILRASRRMLLDCIEAEFEELEFLHCGGDGVRDEDVEIRAVAIMNAFHEDEVGRVVDTVAHISDPLITSASVPSNTQSDASISVLGKHILYLTGQPRESGLEAAKLVGMTVACVGHRKAEDWGIGYLTQQMQEIIPRRHHPRGV